jgi:hypothetical protein
MMHHSVAKVLVCVCSSMAFFAINLKSDGTVLCRPYVAKVSSVSVGQVTSPAWHMYVCVLDYYDGVSSYFNGVFQKKRSAASSFLSEWNTLGGEIDRVKVADIYQDTVIEVSQAYVFARAFDATEVAALHKEMTAIQKAAGCGPPVYRPHCCALSHPASKTFSFLHAFDQNLMPMCLIPARAFLLL